MLILKTKIAFFLHMPGLLFKNLYFYFSTHHANIILAKIDLCWMRYLHCSRKIYLGGEDVRYD